MTERAGARRERKLRGTGRRLLRLASPWCLAILLACGGAPEPLPSAGAGPASGKEVRVVVRTAMPAVEDVEDRLDLPADLHPHRRAVLAAEVPGTVAEVSVDEGDRVSAGRLLARVDTRALEQAVAEAEAVYRQAAKRLERARNLYEKRSITSADMLDAVTDHDVAEARLASARLDLEKSRLAAPWSGRVATRRVEVGDYVVPGQPMIELVDVSPLEVRAPAPASDAPLLEVGTPVRVRVDALPGKVFEGEIVRLAAELDPQARTLDVEAEIPNPDGRLKPGMLARMEIPRRTLEQALLVPLEAIVDLGDEQVVYVVEEGRARRRVVELATVVGERVVVSSGLEPGLPVIVEGEQKVSDGQQVEESGTSGAVRTAATGGGEPAP